MTKNICEQFNAKIAKSRGLPAISMKKEIRCYIMRKMNKEKWLQVGYIGPITPHAQKVCFVWYIICSLCFHWCYPNIGFDSYCRNWNLLKKIVLNGLLNGLKTRMVVSLRLLACQPKCVSTWINKLTHVEYGSCVMCLVCMLMLLLDLKTWSHKILFTTAC